MAHVGIEYPKSVTPLDTRPSIISFLFRLLSYVFIVRIAMVQGMFVAMRKDFFLQLGGFDTGMQIWGTEQVELSIKVFS